MCASSSASTTDGGQPLVYEAAERAAIDALCTPEIGCASGWEHQAMCVDRLLPLYFGEPMQSSARSELLQAHASCEAALACGADVTVECGARSALATDPACAR